MASNHTKVIVLSDEPVDFDYSISYEIAKRLSLGLPLHNINKHINIQRQEELYIRQRI
uniref:Uncharacterized protein n=1 Tax=Acrobeloides nanus TaxID=290746 RepID=A0A914CFU5_9BILA